MVVEVKSIALTVELRNKYDYTSQTHSSPHVRTFTDL